MAFPCATVLAACAILGSGCSHEYQTSPKRFPVGVYGVTDPGQLAGLRKAKFDSFHTYESDPDLLKRLAMEARRQNLRMLAYPDRLRRSSISGTHGWPLEAWYLLDEPDVLGTPVSDLQRLSAATRRWDSRRLQTFVIGQGTAAAKYGHIADILMLDWYPIPHLELDSVADQIDSARGYLPEGKPFWFVVQSFDWRDYPQRDPKKPRVGRFPNREEIRFMSYLALLHGANGLFYFTLSKPGGRTLFDRPEEFQALTRVVSEIKSLQPVLEAGVSRSPPYSSLADGVEGRAWSYRRREYVVVLNRRKELRPLPRELLDPRWRPLFEVRRAQRDLLKGSEGNWQLSPYQVLVLEGRRKEPRAANYEWRWSILKRLNFV